MFFIACNTKSNYNKKDDVRIDTVNAIGFNIQMRQNREYYGSSIIAYGFEMWNDMNFGYGMLKHSIDFMQKEKDNVKEFIRDN